MIILTFACLFNDFNLASVIFKLLSFVFISISFLFMADTVFATLFASSARFLICTGIFTPSFGIEFLIVVCISFLILLASKSKPPFLLKSLLYAISCIEFNAVKASLAPSTLFSNSLK